MSGTLTAAPGYIYLPRVCDTVLEQETILPIDEVFHHSQSCFVKDNLLWRLWPKHFRESELVVDIADSWRGAFECGGVSWRVHQHGRFSFDGNALLIFPR